MGQGIERLSAIEIKNAKPNSGKARILADGGGLRLLITVAGAKYWQFRSKVAGKETTLQLGVYPRMSLAEARLEAHRLRRQKDEGLDPAQERKLENLQLKASNSATFQSVAERMIEAKIANGISDSYLKKIRGALSANLYGEIGQIPIQKINSPLLKATLMPIQLRGSKDMLRVVRGITAEVFNYAKAEGVFSGDNPADALRKNVFATHRVKHMAALEWSRMNGYLNRLDACSGGFPTRCCVHLLIFTACRPSEAREAKWSEFNLDDASWTIPAIRAKGRKDHVVPLARQTVAMLRTLKDLTGHKVFLFPGGRGSESPTLSSDGVLDCVRRIDGPDSKITVHGFRAVFRTHAEESGLWSFEVMEAALSHGKKNAVVAAYARATHYGERKKLAQWYADQLDEVKRGTIITIAPQKVA